MNGSKIIASLYSDLFLIVVVSMSCIAT